MICFDVYVNGEKVCRSGKKDLSVMSCILSCARQSENYEKDEIGLHVGGMFEHSKARIHPSWIDRLDLKAGDDVLIRIVESGTADEAIKEVAYTVEDDRRQEMAYFEQMRKKFENEPN